jgi:ABC-type transport system substrate-binding protein
MRALALAHILALVVVVASCTRDKDDKGGRSATTGEPASTQAAATVRRGGTLLVALARNPSNFDPMVQGDVYSGAIAGNVFEGLYKYGESYTPQPWLAERVEQPDELTWVFHLRNGIKFHDGTELDAEAVKFSMDRIRQNPQSPRYRDAQEIVETAVEDRYTFRLTLRDPFAPLPTRLTGGLGAVVSPAAVKRMGDDRFALQPVGTGPFRFGEWKHDSHVRLGRFDGYWRTGADGRPLPYLDAVEWRIITEPTINLTALQSGDVHVAGVRDQDLPLVSRDPNLVLAWDRRAASGYFGLFLTINRPPFDNKALRQAVAYAIDREEIIRVIYEGNAVVSHGPIPPSLSWAVDPEYKPYTYNPQKAREKLAEGGRPGGFEFEHWIAAGDSQRQQEAELIQAQLARVGIRMRIEQGDFNGVVGPKLLNGESNAYAVSHNTGLDPDTVLSMAYLTGNPFPYSNERVDALIKQGRRTTNIHERAPIYKEMVRLIMEDSPYIFTVHFVGRFIGNKKVQGWSFGPRLATGYAEHWLAE